MKSHRQSPQHKRSATAFPHQRWPSSWQERPTTHMFGLRGPLGSRQLPPPSSTQEPCWLQVWGQQGPAGAYWGRGEGPGEASTAATCLHTTAPLTSAPPLAAAPVVQALPGGQAAWDFLGSSSCDARPRWWPSRFFFPSSGQSWPGLSFITPSHRLTPSAIGTCSPPPQHLVSSWSSSSIPRPFSPRPLSLHTQTLPSFGSNGALSDHPASSSATGASHGPSSFVIHRPHSVQSPRHPRPPSLRLPPPHPDSTR